jgi:putative ABC transport system substrate-binding protein
VANAQQAERMRRIGVLMPFAKDNSESQARLAAFLQALQQLGWNERNLHVEYRWTGGDPDSSRKAAMELAAMPLDVVFATATLSVAALQQATRTLPIVFVMVADPVAAGFVASLAKPGGNITGFPNFEYGIGTKWLELLKEIAPRVGRVGIIRDPTVNSNVGQYAAIQSVAPSFGVELTPLGGRDAKEIEQTISEFARGSNCGLICAAAPLTLNNRNLIISLAARHKMPATYPFRYFVADGGLMSYGADVINFYRQAASYVDRILKGEKPADLPVQAATKYELAINLKTAKALGLGVPQTLLARADEVIE